MEILLKNVRLSYPKLWKAVEYIPGDNKPRFGAAVLIDKGSEQDLAIRKIIHDLMLEAYKTEEKVALHMDLWEKNTQKNCYVGGEVKPDPNTAGKMVLSCHRSQKDGPPAICDRRKQDLTELSGKPYGGCFVNFVADLYVQGPDSPNPGIRASFNAVQFFRDGPAFGAAPASTDRFEDLGDGADDDDDMAGGVSIPDNAEDMA